MHLTRRMRLIWHKLWLIPLVGATADVVASEAAKLGGVTVPMPWLFSAIGVAGMLGAAVARAYSVPLIPEGLEGPDETLTRRSRVLGERLGATPVRVFVSDLPKLRGKVDTFLDGHDLVVSERVAELPEAERDFVLARELAARRPGEMRNRQMAQVAIWLIWGCLALNFRFLSRPSSADEILVWSIREVSTFALLLVGLTLVLNRRYGPQMGELDWNQLALGSTGDPVGAGTAIRALADTDAEKEQAALEAKALEQWWTATGQKAVEASEWYQRELAKAPDSTNTSSAARRAGRSTTRTRPRSSGTTWRGI